MAGFPTLYDMIIKPYRDMDADGLLQRFLERPQYHLEQLQAIIERLPDLDDPAKCPDDLLQYYKDEFGFTSDLRYITDDLAPLELRKLISLAIPLWRMKGTASGLRAICKILTGHNPIYRDWFWYRPLASEGEGIWVGAAEEGLDGYSVFDSGENISVLKLVDDGNLNETMLVHLIQLIRPMNETIVVRLMDFMDTFTDSPDRWERLEGSPVPTIDEGELVVPPGAISKAMIMSVAPEIMNAYDIEHTVEFEDAADVHEVRWLTVYNDPLTNGYLRLRLSPTSPHVVIDEVVIGVGETSIYSADLLGGIVLTPGVRAGVRIETSVSAVDDPYFKVYVDNVLQYATPDAGYNGTFHAGSVVIAAPVANTGNVRLDNFEIWRTPSRFASIGPAGVTASDTFYD